MMQIEVGCLALSVPLLISSMSRKAGAILILSIRRPGLADLSLDPSGIAEGANAWTQSKKLENAHRNQVLSSNLLVTSICSTNISVPNITR